MSIMTSLYPSFHGVTGKNYPLADKHATLAELLLQSGFRTAAFTDGAWLRPHFGFKKGFEYYFSEWIGIAKILPLVKNWLDKNKSRPFFLFIHCYDIHAPYATGKPPYDTMFHDFTYTGTLTPTLETLQAAAEWKIPTTDEDVRHFVAMYDGGIRYTDTKIGEFLSYLKETGLYDQSLIIITSDHGEEFKEHGSFQHWRLYYRPELHVPLMMHIPSYPAKGIRIDGLVQSVDIMPTILELVGIPPHQQAQGKSLVSLIKEHANFINRAMGKAYRFYRKESRPSFAKEQDYYSIIKDDYQLIYNTKSTGTELFYLKDDPLTQKNIAKVHGAITNRLLSQLKEAERITPRPEGSAAALDQKTREELKALGYIQ
jgi:arylsulfatase A-like enzyme